MYFYILFPVVAVFQIMNYLFLYPFPIVTMCQFTNYFYILFPIVTMFQIMNRWAEEDRVVKVLQQFVKH